MRPGVVVSIRVNPKDCMGVLDVLEKAGIVTPGASFPSLISLALGSLLETARQNNMIPTRTGFEFSEMMAPYLKQPRNKKKLEIAKTIHSIGSDIVSPTLEEPPQISQREHKVQQAAKVIAHTNVDNTYQISHQNIAETRPRRPVEAVPLEERIRAQQRLQRLCEEKDMCDDLSTGMRWTNEKEAEYQRCYAIVYPEG